MLQMWFPFFSAVSNASANELRDEERCAAEKPCSKKALTGAKRGPVRARDEKIDRLLSDGILLKCNGALAEKVICCNEWINFATTEWGCWVEGG